MSQPIAQRASASAPKVVTLANFAACTDQEVYDHVCYRMAKRGFGQSMSTQGQCAYRGSAGSECAAGSCMSDAEYRELRDQARYETPDGPGDLEGCSWSDLQEFGLVPLDHFDLMVGLQRDHDRGVTAVEMRAALRDRGTRLGLSTAILDSRSA